MRRLKPATGLWEIQPKGCNAKKTTTVVGNIGNDRGKQRDELDRRQTVPFQLKLHVVVDVALSAFLLSRFILSHQTYSIL